MRAPDAATERRLDEIREQAALRGRGGEVQRIPSYFGLPLLKEPVWSWEVPIYFFVGGAAGASAVIAAMARDQVLARDARAHAAIGGLLSAPLLISDLGRPKRFLYMLRVFKPQSTMSVGAWTVAAFGGFALGSAAFGSQVFAIPAAALGLIMSTYTGVLLGATSIPAWSKHAKLLPAHFGASAVAAATSLLELRGHNEDALNTLATLAAAFETATIRKTDTTRQIAGFFSGPLPLLLRLLGKRKAAAASAILGSLVTRMAWVEAGKASARDPEAVLSSGR